MSIHDQTNIFSPNHQQCWELLPWYVNNTLEEVQCNEVAEHVKTCLTCLREINLIQNMGHAIRETEPFSFSQQTGLERLRMRIQAEKPQLHKQTSAWIEPWSSLRNLTNNIRKAHPFVQRTLVAQSMIIAVALGIIFWPTPQENRLPFITLSDPVITTKYRGPAIRVVFSDEATEGTIRKILLECHAQIISGPSPFGVYTIIVEESRIDILKELRSYEEVQFAESALSHS